METKAVKIFEYRKNNNKHWDRSKINKQVFIKVLPIIKKLYFRYLLLFLFDNIINHLIYTKNVL